MTESKWYELITSWESSGLSQREFCKQQGVEFKAFKYWRTEGIASGKFTASNRWASKETPPDFSKVMLSTEADLPSINTNESPRFIELTLPHGITLKLPV